MQHAQHAPACIPYPHAAPSCPPARNRRLVGTTLYLSELPALMLASTGPFSVLVTLRVAVYSCEVYYLLFSCIKISRKKIIISVARRQGPPG